MGSGSALVQSHNRSEKFHFENGETPEDFTMDSARIGLDYIVENPDYVHKLASALGSSAENVKKQVFELLSALCVYSSEGYERTMEALEQLQRKSGARYRFKFIVDELGAKVGSVEYKTAVLAFINCLILATPELRERIRVRSQFIALTLLTILREFRERQKNETDLMVQVDVFEEQRESDEGEGEGGGLKGINLNLPLDLFEGIMRAVGGGPQEAPFLAILQHLLRIEPKDPISDLMWDTAERLVHRAVLIESPEDAHKLLNTQSVKIETGPSNGICHCQKNNRRQSLTSGDIEATKGGGGPPPPPPPVPPPPPPPLLLGGSPPPPPPPPFSSAAPPPPPNPVVNTRLPQQSIPQPKSKMRTVNWNKIPSNAVLAGNKDNLWATLATRNSKRKMSLDWNALEGLFCIPTESKVNECTVASPKKLAKKESAEITLLDAKRSLNINIFLKQFRKSNEEIISLLEQGASEEFGRERLQGLLKMLPSSDELEMLSSVKEEERGRLGPPETFLLSLVRLPGYRLRIEAMLLKEHFRSSLPTIQSSIDAILEALHNVKDSKEFQEVLFMVVMAGNFLNSGGYAGDAAGVKLTSLQKICDIRGNKPGVSLLHFIAKEAETRDEKLISFVDDFSVIQEASKSSVESLKTELNQLKSRVENVNKQMESKDAPRRIVNQMSSFIEEAKEEIEHVENELNRVEDARVELAAYFCEDPGTFKLEDALKILSTFISKWKLAAAENRRRRTEESQAEARRAARVLASDVTKSVRRPDTSGPPNFITANSVMTPEDDIFIACSPRIVRRSYNGSSKPTEISNGNHLQTEPHSLPLPSPDVTPNGSLRRRRSRLPSSDEDEGNLMEYLRGSTAVPSKRLDQYGSLDRSWSRKTRARPNILDFVNDDRERPVSPAPVINTPVTTPGSENGAMESHSKTNGSSITPKREWRQRISNWFVDLENGSSARTNAGDSEEISKDGHSEPKKVRSTLPSITGTNGRRHHRFKDGHRSDGTGNGLATLPEGDVATDPDPKVSPSEPSLVNPRKVPYKRVYEDRKPSVQLNTDVVKAMETIEDVQEAPKENKPLSTWRRPSQNSRRTEPTVQKKSKDRKSLIESLGAENKEEKLVLYIPEESVIGSSPLSRSKSLRTERKKEGDPNLSFDRFASMRRSRRYKKDESEEEPTTAVRNTARWRSRDQRSESSIEPKQVAQALRLHNPSVSHNKSAHLLGDRDEGFEECTNGLSTENELRYNKSSASGSNKDKSKWSSLLLSRQKNKTNSNGSIVDKKVIDPNHNEIRTSSMNGSIKSNKESSTSSRKVEGLINGSVVNHNKRKESSDTTDDKKGLPRLYSFMRPTAASSAKDRAERIKNTGYNVSNGAPANLLNRSNSVNRKKPSPSASLFSKHAFR